MDKQLVKMRLADIIPYENNPRHNDNAVEAVKESIRQCEYIAPIIVDEDNVILAGHTRAKALAELGKTDADVVVVSGLTDEQKRKYRLLDNKTAEASSWDIDLLEIELDGLDFEGFDFGFDDGFIGEEDIDGGEIKDKTNSRIAVKLVFENTKAFKSVEQDLRNYVDTLKGVNVSVGEYDEN